MGAVTAGPSSWSGRQVLVTGATGILGSWLVKELLRAQASVVALMLDADPTSELARSGDLARVAVVNGDLADYNIVERAIVLHEVDTVFHLGAQTIVSAAWRSPLATFESNIRGTYNLLEACRRHGDVVERIVVASSDKAYGSQAFLPYDETMPLQGRHPYDASKSCADLLAQCYSTTYGLPVGIARCGNLYGGGDKNWSRIVPGTIRSLFRGERPVIRSNGRFLRDYLYVEDATTAYLDLADGLGDDRIRGQAFNFGNEVPLTVLEIVEEIQRLMGVEDVRPDIRNTAVGEIEEQYLSAKKARALLGWEPRFDLALGLGRTIPWYQSLLAVYPGGAAGTGGVADSAV